MVSLPDQMPAFPPPTALPKRVSLVAQAVESLRAHLRAGHWAQRLPAERELCQHLQISRPTVRAALQELEREGFIELSGRTRRLTLEKRVRAAAGSSSRVIAALSAVPLRDMPPTALFMLDTLRDKLARAGFTMEHRVDPACFSAQPARALEKLFQTLPAAAWVAWGSKAPMQRWFIQRQLPVVVLGSCDAGIPLASFDVDFRAACRHAGDLFWRKGHRRLAIVQRRDAYGGDVASEQGFREALAHHAGAQFTVLSHDGSHSHLCAVLDRALRAAEPPTAYLVLGSAYALTVTMHLLRRRVRIPEDAAIVSRDDETYFQHTSPVISRYSYDPVHFVRNLARAVRQLAETGTLAPQAVRVIPRLIAGETV